MSQKITKELLSYGAKITNINNYNKNKGLKCFGI